jgi:hypothetical protein
MKLPFQHEYVFLLCYISVTIINSNLNKLRQNLPGAHLGKYSILLLVIPFTIIHVTGWKDVMYTFSVTS